MTLSVDHWRKRVNIPAYSVRDAAKFARTSPQTISYWQKLGQGESSALSARDPRMALSYMQLIEIGVVAAMRKAGVPLKTIRKARDYLAKNFNSKHPFAEYRFKTSGKDLIVDSEELKKSDRDKLVVVSENGQYAWKQILQQLLQEFEYSSDENGMVTRWNVAGRDVPIVIDPRIAYGLPSVNGVQTAVIKNRWIGGESLDDIAEDFDIEKSVIMSALKFENADQVHQWLN